MKKKLHTHNLIRKAKSIAIAFLAIVFTLSVSAVPIRSGTYPVTAVSSNNVQLTDFSFVTVNSIGSAIALLNSNGVEFLGTVQFDFADGYSETATSQYDIGSAGSVLFSTVYTAVIFKHNGVGANPRLTASTPGTQNNAGGGSGDYIIRMNGADNITFDGIDLRENPANTVTASATLTTTAAPMEYGYYIRNSGANPAQNNTIKNCTITMYNYVNSASTQSSTNSYGVAQYCDLASAPNSGNLYENINVTRAYKGIYLRGQAGTEDVGCIIRNCTIGGTGSGDGIGSFSATYNGTVDAIGIWVVSQKDFIVYNNTIQNVQQSHISSSGTAQGLLLASNTGASTINNNKIYKVTNGRTGSSTAVIAAGIDIQASSGSMDIYNNMIGSIQHNCTNSTTFMLFGIRLQDGGTFNLYHNSVQLPNISNTIQQCGSAALYLQNTFTGTVNAVDNMLSNSIGTNLSNPKAYCIYYGGTGTLGTFDYNILDVTPNSTNRRYTGFYGSDQLTLANWKLASGKDANSQQFVIPYFTTSDLHLNLAAPNVIYTGTFISSPSITTDIDGEIRSYPFIGADEKIFTLDPQVFISSNHPSDSLVALNTSNNLLAGIALNVSGVANTLTSITFTTAGTYTTSGLIDFTNVTLWYSSSPVFSTGTATVLNNTTYATTMPAVGANNLTFTGLSLSLPLGATYIYVTFNVALNATPGHNVRVANTSFTNITFGNGATTKVGINPVPQGGLQTIAQFYYNYANTDFTDESGWYENVTGLNLPPSNFTDPNQVFVFNANTGSVMGWNTLKTSWNVSGTNTRIIVGDGINPVLVEAKLPIVTGTGVTMDVRDKGHIKFQSSYIPTRLGVLSPATVSTIGSTVEYGDTSVTVTIDTIIIANYCNLILSGTTTGLAKRFFNYGTVGVSRLFTPGGFAGATRGQIHFNGTVVAQTIPSGFNFWGLRVNNGVGTTTLAGNVQVDSSLRFNTNLNVTAGQVLTLGATATVTAPVVGTGILNITGAGAALTNTNPLTTTFLGTAATLNPYIVFGAGSFYNLSATLSSTLNNYGQIPPATWDVNSTINITNVTTAGTNSIVVGPPASSLFGNITFDAPALAADYRLFGGINNTNAAGAGTALTPWLVNLLGNLTIGKTGTGTLYTVDLGAGTTAQSSTINIAKKLNQSDGIYRLLNTASGTQHVDIAVTDDITLSNATQLILSGPGAGSLASISAGNNFTANSGTTITGSVAGVNNKIIFTKAGTQLFTINGATVANDINYIVNNGSITRLGTLSSLTVTAASYINLTTGGIFDIAAGNTLTVNGTINKWGAAGGFYTGTFSGTPTSDMVLLGSVALDTVGFTSGSAVLQNLTVNHSGTPTILVSGSTGLTVHGLLTIGTNTNNTLDLGVNQLLAGGSFSNAINATGILKTQNTAAVPIPAGYTWGGTVWYNSTSAQTMVNGNFNILNGTNGNRTLTSTGTIGISGATNPTCFIPGAGVYSIYNSTIDFNGSGAQNVPSFMYENMVSSNASSTKTLVGNISIKKSLTLSNTTTLQLANFNLNVLSSDTLTARLNPVTTAATIGYAGTGLAYVQRYFPAQRKWRLVTTPVIPAVASTPTISVAWQEGQTGVADSSGTGFWATKITGGTIGNGFDPSPNNAPSIKYFNAGSWLAPANTNALSVKSQEGWMLFVRGDRKNYGLVTDQYKTPTITTLRPRGQLFIGAKTISTVAAGYKVIGNPYASAIDFNSIYTSRTGAGWPANATYVVWDPTLGGANGQGAFVTFTWNAGVFLRTSPYGAGSYDSRYIPSSAAFLVNFPASSSLTINETDKNTANTTTAFRPIGTNHSMLTVLNTVNPDNSTYVSDGTLSLFDGSFNSSADVNDAIKLGNFSENFGLQREGKVLSIERMKTVGENDTIFYYIGRMQQKKYQLQFIMDNVDAPSYLTALLEDTYLKTKTVVSLQDTTRIDFNVTTDEASKASDRFRLVFKRSVKYTRLNAFVLNSDIAVDWKVSEEFDINQYSIERSLNGVDFAKIGETVSKGNSDIPVGYRWLDASPEPGEYYYRIRSVSNSGVIVYSEAVKVKIVKGSPVLYVFPNPVTNNAIQLQLNSALPGKYSTRLTGSGGQLVNSAILSHPGGTATKVISPSYQLSNGNYQLEVTGPDKKVTIIKVLVNSK